MIVLKESKTLFLFAPGQPEYELVAAGSDTFKLKMVDGYRIQFTKPDAVKIDGLLFIQPNGTFKAVRR